MAQIGLRRFFCLSLTCPILGRPNAIFPYAGAAWCTSFFSRTPGSAGRLTPFNKYGARMALQNGVSRH
ncbi:hypothetical protein NDU88_006504 [Pleurodeles waltl]|uniref:Secreted protein n=1 Tax=Pleurodeles waltl TaxID=8319 RepID=A0AAV7X2U9_PLEWA|nr:hypothetical protein NDU88_006504 [Pleurodeles waltl]